VAPYKRCPSTSALQRAQYADLHVYLPNDPLVKVDRASMAHGLEIRCPLLDHRVIELAFRLPAERKLRGSESKYYLRQLGRRRLPAGHDTLPKRGFTVPIGAWIRGPYREWFRDDVLGSSAASAAVFDPSVIRRWFSEHVSGERDHGAALWTIWCFERWSRLLSGSPARAA
jgi:asparagine synthase (glutamine-hydrolysing)